MRPFLILETKHLPKTTAAMTLWPIILVQKDYWSQISEEDKEDILRHEIIHVWQQWECLVAPFYLIYGLNWLVNLIKYKDAQRAYRMIVFEREAYDNEDKQPYKRRVFAWLKYIF
jgi:hypothetical protein